MTCVRKSNLMLVLGYKQGIVSAADGIDNYWRIDIVHTRDESHFVEISCDLGVSVDSMDCHERVDIYKSELSITIARKCYPNREFILGTSLRGTRVSRILPHHIHW